MKNTIVRAYHLLQRIIRESKQYQTNRKQFGTHIANLKFKDGLIPPGKSPSYIRKIEHYIDVSLADFINNYKFGDLGNEKYPGFSKIPVWVCWWQGEDSMPELVKMCYARLKQVINSEKMEIHLITLENYKEDVTFPEHITQKFEQKIITMTTLSDILRMCLLSKYGGMWVDATVFFTDSIPEVFFEKTFYSQKMAQTEAAKREACRSLWCGFCMAGYSYNPMFHFTRDAFFEWWKKYDDIVDYVLIDYLILEGYKNFEEIRAVIDEVPDNNEDVFKMYQVLNQEYTPELYQRLTKRNFIHKLTYKMDLQKETSEGNDTLYGHLLKEVYGNERAC